MGVRFKSFSSGSCGNAYYLGTEDGAVLIDAGVSLRLLKKELEREGLGLDSFSAVLVTHDHMDHIRSLGSYCKRLHVPVWATPTLMDKMSRRSLTGEYLADVRNELADGWNEIIPGVISVRFFIVPHDASQTVGFAIMLGGLRYVHITDCGRMTREALDWCRQADAVTIESNYDPAMLASGPYPLELQERIRNGNGHLSNGECAEAIRCFLHPGLKNIFLCHLSEHNNTPLLALETSRAVLAGCENGPRLVALPRQTPSLMFNL